MIEVAQIPLQHTRTPDRACLWLVACKVDNVVYSAESRIGAVNELARVLVAADIPDDEMVVYPGGSRQPSFHAMAHWAYEESASTPLHRIPNARLEARRKALRARSTPPT